MGQYNEVRRLGTFKAGDNKPKLEAANTLTNTTVSRLTALPTELQLEILSYLDLLAFLAIRRTCTLYRALVTPTSIARALTVAGGPWPNEPHVYDLSLDSVCTVCLCRPTAGYGPGEERNDQGDHIGRPQINLPRRSRPLDALIVDLSRPRQTWRSLCHRCWRLGLVGEGSSSLPPTSQRISSSPSPSTSRPSAPPGPYLPLISGHSALPCGFCGWPVTYRESGSWESTVESYRSGMELESFVAPQFHALGGKGKGAKSWKDRKWAINNCVWRKRLVTTTWALLGVLQACIGIVTASIAWGVYPGIKAVMVPVSINFALAWVSLILVGYANVRSTPSTLRTFRLLLVPEGIAVAVWIPAVVSTAILKLYPEELARDDGFPIFAETMFAFNMLLRILNTAGYAILCSGYDPRSPYIPHLPRWRKAGYFVLTMLTWWSFPRW